MNFPLGPHLFVHDDEVAPLLRLLVSTNDETLRPLRERAWVAIGYIDPDYIKPVA